VEANPEALVLNPKTLYFFADGFKHGNNQAFLNNFVSEDRKLDKVAATIYQTYEETSMNERKKRNHVETNTDTVEFLTVVATQELQTLLPLRKRLHCENQTNRNNHWGPIVTEHPDKTWQMTFFDKKLFYGESRIPASGASGNKDKERVYIIIIIIRIIKHHCIETLNKQQELGITLRTRFGLGP